MVTSGSLNGWITPLLSRLLGPDSEIPMTAVESSWVASFVELGSLFSPVPVGLLINHVGRKPMLMATGPLYIITWLIIVLWPSVEVLATMRIAQGLIMGLSATATPIYLGEISSSKNRGAITSLFYNTYAVGYIISYTLGSFMNFYSFTYFTLALNVPFILMFFWQPETPYYYLIKGDLQKAYESLKWLRDGSEEELREELEEMQASLEVDVDKSARFKDLLATSGDRRATFLIIVLSAVRMSSGSGALVVYVTDVFNQTPNLSVPADYVTIAFGIVMLLGGIFSSFTSDIVGRRTLLLGSSFGCLVCTLFTGTYYFLLTNTTADVSQSSWISPVLILLYCFLCNAGMYPVCTSYTSELFSDKTRGLASSVGMTVTTLVTFLTMLLYPGLTSWLGLYANFYFYTLSALVGVLCFFAYAPETKGKSFGQIRRELCKESMVVES